jgi:hypothetical protein
MTPPAVQAPGAPGLFSGIAERADHATFAALISCIGTLDSGGHQYHMKSN